jgi:hypothetical protein
MGRHRRLVIDSCRFRFRKEFLKAWVVADWVPDRIDLETRNRNVFSSRDCEQAAEYFYCLLGLTSVRFDLG